MTKHSLIYAVKEKRNAIFFLVCNPPLFESSLYYFSTLPHPIMKKNQFFLCNFQGNYYDFSYFF